MSYQAIIDIIVNPNQLQELQLSNTVKDSPKQPAVSFGDYLASFNKTEVKSEEKTAAVENKTEQTGSSEKADKAEKTENQSENQVENEKKPEEASEKSVKETDSEQESDSKISEKSDEKTKDEKNSINSQEPELKESKDSKKASKSDSKNSKDLKNKKLSEKDFARLEEISEKAGTEIDSSKLAAMASDNINSEDKSDLKAEKEGDELPELSVKADAESQNTVKTLQTEENNNKDFDFSGKDEKSKKTFTLDKEGKITVEDQRTEKLTEADDSKKSVLKTSEVKLANENTAVMSVELNPNAEADVLSLNNQTAASNGSNFQAMLSNQLHNVAPEFVKAGNLILKDNNQGTINLILHPDDLGNVKIHLSLDGKTLSGHITVASKEALQVFKDNAETLREAFIKNGFEAASFDVAMNNGGSFNQSMGFEGQDDGRQLLGKRLYGDSAEGLSAELDNILENAEDISNYSVNIVA